MSSQMSGIELLKLGDQDRRDKLILNKFWPYILGPPFGIATGVFINLGTRRPVFSGIQKHVISSVGWTGIFYYAQKRRDDYFAEKDAVYRHYIELHPEDFPVPPRKKIGEIFEPWSPIR